MYCKNCGFKIDDGTKFCPECGIEQKKTLYSIEKDRTIEAEDDLIIRKKNQFFFIGIVILAIILVVLNIPYDTNDPYTDTEYYTEKEPYTDTEYYTEKEPYIDTEYYTEKEPYTDTEYSGTLWDLGFLDLTRNQYNFNGASNYKSEYTGTDQTGHKDYYFIIYFGSDSNYKTYEGINKWNIDTKYVTKYRDVTKSREVTKYRDVTKSREVTKYRDVTKSREVVKIKLTKLSLIQRSGIYPTVLSNYPTMIGAVLVSIIAIYLVSRKIN